MLGRRYVTWTLERFSERGATLPRIERVTLGGASLISTQDCPDWVTVLLANFFGHNSHDISGAPIYSSNPNYFPPAHKRDYHLASASFSDLIPCHLPPHSSPVQMACLPFLEHAKKAPVSAPLHLEFSWLGFIIGMAGSFLVFRLQIKCHLSREGFLDVPSKVADPFLFPSYNFSLFEIICL